MLLIGPSSVGKSRSVYEAISALLPDWWLLHPDPAGDLTSTADSPQCGSDATTH